MLLPHAYGGAEFDPVSFVQVIEVIRQTRRQHCLDPVPDLGRRHDRGAAAARDRVRGVARSARVPRLEPERERACRGGGGRSRERHLRLRQRLLDTQRGLAATAASASPTGRRGARLRASLLRDERSSRNRSSDRIRGPTWRRPRALRKWHGSTAPAAARSWSTGVSPISAISTRVHGTTIVDVADPELREASDRGVDRHVPPEGRFDAHLAIVLVSSYTLIGLFERRAINGANAMSLMFLMAVTLIMREDALAHVRRVVDRRTRQGRRRRSSARGAALRLDAAGVPAPSSLRSRGKVPTEG